MIFSSLDDLSVSFSSLSNFLPPKQKFPMTRCNKHRVKCTTTDCGKCYRCTIPQGGCNHNNSAKKKRKVTNGKGNVRAASSSSNGPQTLNEDALADAYGVQLDSIADFQPLPSPRAKLREVCSTLGINFNDDLPTLSERMEQSEWNEVNRASAMLSSMESMVNAIAGEIYPANVRELKLKVAGSVYEEYGIPEDKRAMATVHSMCESIIALPKGSTQGDALLSCLCQHFTFKQLQNIFRQHDSNIGPERYTEGKKKMQSIKVGVELVKTKKVLTNYKQHAVEKAVDFILSEENIQVLSWGTKQVQIGKRTVSLPKLCRKRIPTNILRAYTESIQDEDSIGDSSFLKLVNTLTFNDMRSATAVDYATGILLYDNFQMVKSIIDTIEDVEKVKIFRVRAEKVVLFVKSTFPKHLTKDGPSDSGHNLEYGLCGQGYSVSPHTCKDCQMPFKFFHDLKNAVEGSQHELLADCQSKVSLYMGHIVRVVNQRLAIKDELDQLQQHPNRAYVVIDYKMKMIPVYFREKTLEHYGKKGMSWHGAMLYMKQSCDESDGEGVHGMELEDLLTTYYDHISDGDSKQDWQAVLSICEAIIRRIEVDYPHIDEVYLQSDNARCYQNAMLLFGLMLISKGREKVRIIKVIHSETQDGKCSIDAHFAVAMGHIMRYVNEGNNVISPVQLAYALSENAQLNNCIAELFSLDRPKVEELIVEHQFGFSACEKNIKRSNEAVFDYTENSITVFEYSNINKSKKVVSLDEEKQPGGEHDGHVTDHGGEENDEHEFDVDEDDLLGGTVLDNLLEIGEDDASSGESDDEDDEEDHENDIGHTITGVTVVGDHKLLKKSKRWKRNTKRVTNIVLEDLDRHCPLCEYTFQSQAKRNSHYCRPKSSPSDLLSHAVLYADTRWATMNIIQSSDVNMPMNEDDQDDQIYHQFLPGWAIRPAHGHCYGKKYIKNFMDDVLEMFEEGEKDKSHKMGPGRMRERLMNKYPDRLDIPSEAELRQAISKFVSQVRVGTAPTLTGTRGRKSTIPQRVVYHLAKFYCENKDLTWKNFANPLKQYFQESNIEWLDGFSESQIKSKHSNYRSAFSKNQTLPITDLVEPTGDQTSSGDAGATDVPTVQSAVDETSSVACETPIVLTDR